MKRAFATLFLFLSVAPFLTAAAQAVTAPTPTANDATMKWFKDAKLGIFIHWGIYAVNGIDESWSFFNGMISHEDYMKQLRGFTAQNYKPHQWAALIKASGARYAVLTSKHHDGVALWDSKFGGTDLVKNSPARRDLIRPFVDELRKNDLKVGLYFSLIDWSHPDYDIFTKTEKRYTNDPPRWSKFLRYYQGQLKEISDKYNPDLFWFDGDWEHTAAEWESEKVRQMLLTRNPNTILNSRLVGHGDYATPEQGVPVVRPSAKFWELCLTMNDNWGYQQRDANYKTPNQIIRILIDCIGMGGNLLLDIGPKADGTIPAEQVNICRELGRWTTKHKEAIYGTEAGIPLEHFYGRTTLSADRKTLYLFLDGKPNGPIAVKGLVNNVQRARIVGNGTKLNTKVIGKLYWSEVPGTLYIDVPPDVQDKDVTVVALQLDSPISLYPREN